MNGRSPGVSSPSGFFAGRFIVLAGFCILSGVLLLLENFGYIGRVSPFWPIFPLLIGAGFILLFLKRRRREVLLFGLGTYILQISLLFLFLSLSAWSAMKDLWPLFITFLGTSILLCTPFSRIRRPLLLSSFLLLALSTVFIMVFSIDPALWPVSLILFGLWLIFLKRFDR